MPLYSLGLLISVVAAAAVFVWRRAERRGMVTSGLLLVPAGTAHAPISEGWYWTPPRLLGGSFGLEDVVFCLCFGVLGWGLTAALAGPLPPLAPLTARFVGRCLAAGALGATIMAAAVWAGGGYGVSIFAAQAGVGATVLALRPRLWRLALAGAAALTAYYLAAMSLASLVLGPGFGDMWVETDRLGPALLGVPVEEYLWMISFGAVWVPLLVFASEPRAAG